MLLSQLARLAQHRLLTFTLVGGVLFALASRAEASKVIAIEPEALESLRAAQAKKLSVPVLGEDGRREVDARAIEDEVLYREAVRLGLDQGDPIVRQRLVQKLLLLVEDLGGGSREPTRAELIAHYEGSRDAWRRPARYSIVHVFASEPSRLPEAEVLTDQTVPPSAGEPFPYPRATTMSEAEMERAFGAAFARAVVGLDPGGVAGHVRSTYGWHHVRLVERVPGAVAPFAEVEKDVALDFLLRRREAIVGGYLERTVASYDIRVGGEPLRGFVPTRRVAARAEASAED